LISLASNIGPTLQRRTMKFQLVINMERMQSDISMDEVMRHNLQMVQVAEEGGFESVWAAEHHALEMTIAPNPFQILTWFAAHTSRIRLGTAVVVAPYWHPINLAGEAALLDLYSGGRLEFGIGSGAYQREFDRMAGGLKQTEGYKYAHEMLPALKALWRGDYEHDGTYWKFPAATSVPKPVQEPHPPIWVAARAPITFDWAVANECNIMTWALTRPFSEVETYKQRLDDALAKHPEAKRPQFTTMRYSAVCASDDQVNAAVDACIGQLGRFENLFKNLGGVNNGFPEVVNLAELSSRQEFSRNTLRENLVFGTPDEVIAKLKRYQALGVDQFTYCASYGLGIPQQQQSLELFIREVMPAFEESQAQTTCS